MEGATDLLACYENVLSQSESSIWCNCPGKSFGEVEICTINYRFGLANPGIVLPHLNKIMLKLQFAEKYDFPNFPLSITLDQAREVVDRISKSRANESWKVAIANGLASMYSMENRCDL